MPTFLGIVGVFLRLNNAGADIKVSFGDNAFAFGLLVLKRFHFLSLSALLRCRVHCVPAALCRTGGCLER